MPAAMAPGRANGLYVVVVGGGERWPFLRGGGNPAVALSESASTGGSSGRVDRTPSNERVGSGGINPVG